MAIWLLEGIRLCFLKLNVSPASIGRYANPWLRQSTLYLASDHVKEKRMSVFEVKTIQNSFAPAQEYVDAKHGLSGDVYCWEAGKQ